MSYFAIFLIIISFIKTIYYGLFELKEKQNKPGAIAVFITAIVRTNSSFFYNFKILCNIIYFRNFFE